MKLAPSTRREHWHSGKILNVVWESKKRGYAEKTIEGYSKRLKMLAKHVSLDNPEAVKTFIANQRSWSNAYKESIANAYTHYGKQCGLSWEKPVYKRSRRLRALFSCLIVSVSYRAQILVERFK